MAVILSMPDPVAFKLFGLEIMWYGVIIAAAIALGILWAMRRAKKKEFSQDTLLDILLLTIPLAIIGARLAFVFSHVSQFSGNWMQIFAFRRGGLAIQGAIAGGIVGVILMCRRKKASPLKAFDIIVPCLLLGQAIGRWGNYFNMEVYGFETTVPWAIAVNDWQKGIIQVHPTFLYECILNLIGVGFLLWYEKKWQKKDGELLCLYLIAYSAIRFFVEFFRTDHVYVFGVNLAQLICVALIVAGFVVMMLIRKKSGLSSNKE